MTISGQGTAAIRAPGSCAQLGRRFDEHMLELSPQGQHTIIRRQMAAECAVALVRIAVKPDVLGQKMLECLLKRTIPASVLLGLLEKLFPVRRLRKWQEPMLSLWDRSLEPFSDTCHRCPREQFARSHDQSSSAPLPVSRGRTRHQADKRRLFAARTAG